MAKKRIHELAEEFGADPKFVLAKLEEMRKLLDPYMPIPRLENSPSCRPVPPDPAPKEAPDWLEYKRMVEAGQIDIGKPLDKPRSGTVAMCLECGHATYSSDNYRCDCGRPAGSAWAMPNNVGRGKRSR